MLPLLPLDDESPLRCAPPEAPSEASPASERSLPEPESSSSEVEDDDSELSSSSSTVAGSKVSRGGRDEPAAVLRLLFAAAEAEADFLPFVAPAALEEGLLVVGGDLPPPAAVVLALPVFCRWELRCCWLEGRSLPESDSEDESEPGGTKVQGSEQKMNERRRRRRI